MPRKSKRLCLSALCRNGPNLVALSAARRLRHKEEAASRTPGGGIWPGEKLSGFEFLIVSRKVVAGADFRRCSAIRRHRHQGRPAIGEVDPKSQTAAIRRYK